jgi:hypothetical protein
MLAFAPMKKNVEIAPIVSLTRESPWILKRAW